MPSCWVAVCIRRRQAVVHGADDESSISETGELA